MTDRLDLDPEAADAALAGRRVLEALLFAAAEPLDTATLSAHLGEGADVAALLSQLAAEYAPRGVNLVQVGGRWTFRTAPDLAHHLERHQVEERKLSRAALETLAIIAYHQKRPDGPQGVTRAEIEDIRGVAVSKGTVDVLLETGWIAPGPRREVPGRPITYRTTPAFLSHFNLARLEDLPGLDDLKAMGLLDSQPLLPNFAAGEDPDDDDMADDAEPPALDMAMPLEDEPGAS